MVSPTVHGRCGAAADKVADKAAAVAAVTRFPALTGRVVDTTALLPVATARRLAARSAALERRTGHQFVIVTVPALEGLDIAAYGRALGNHWGIGRKGHDDGVLLIVAPRDCQVRIEVGCGLEDVLTDAEAAQIIRRDVLPHFRRGDMKGGIVAGAGSILREIGS